MGQRKRNKDRKRKSAPDPRNEERLLSKSTHVFCVTLLLLSIRTRNVLRAAKPKLQNIYIYIFIYIKRERDREGEGGFLQENAMMMASMLLLHSTYLKAQRRRRQSIDKRFACSWCCCCLQWRGRGRGRVPIGLGYPLHYKSNGTKQNKRNGIVSNWQASRGGAHNPPSPPSHPPVRPGR